MQQTIKAGNVSLFVNETGSGDPIIFVHGIPTDYRIWDSQQAELSKEFRTISYSRRAAYPNQNPGNATESTIERNSDDLVNLIQGLGIANTHLVGHSYGGFVSLYTAWKRPELVKSLVLVEPAIPSILVKNEKSPLEVIGFLFSNPGAAMSARRFQNGKLRAALKAYESGDFKAAVKNFYDGIREKDGAFEQAPQSIQKLMLDNGQTIGELESIFPILTKADAAKITIRTLLLKGDQSPKWLRAIVDGLGQSMPKSSVVEVPGSGHLPHIDNPAEFNSKVQNFLTKSSA